MTREDLLARLRKLVDVADTESAHAAADDALIEFIGDREVAEAYEAIPKWYA